MNATSRRRSQSRKTSTTRTLRWTPAIGEGLPLLAITVGKVETKYVVAEIGSDIGRGFYLGKLDGTGDGETYETHVGGNGLCSCTCPGFLWGWACKHCAAMAKVIELGLI